MAGRIAVDLTVQRSKDYIDYHGQRCRWQRHQIYRQTQRLCGSPLKSQCTTGRERRISHDVNQDARDYTRALMQTEDYAVSCAERKKIEALFGEAKHILAFTRLRLRGLAGARDEFLLTATVQNLKRLAKLTARLPPRPMTA